MKTNPLKLAALVVFSSMLFAGCATLLDLLRSNVFREPGLSFRTAALSNISLAGLTLDTIWDLHNPNSIGVSIARVEYALSVEGKQVIAGAPATGLEVRPASTSELHFPAAIRFMDLVGVVEAFLNKDTAAYRAEGRLGIDTPIGLVMLPIVKEGNFEVPKVPQVSLGNPRVTSMSLTGATVEFPLVVTNRNTYGLPVNGLRGALSIGGATVGTLSTGDLGAMQGRGTRTVSLPLTINLLSAASAVGAAVRGGNAAVGFNAQLQSGPASLPLSVQQVVSFVR